MSRPLNKAAESVKDAECGTDASRVQMAPAELW